MKYASQENLERHQCKALQRMDSFDDLIQDPTRLFPYLCNICGKGFDHFMDYRGHLVTHVGSKPFCCTVCEERFNHPVSLYSHYQNLHSQPAALNSNVEEEYKQESVFYCQICKNEFCDEASLTDHLCLPSEGSSLECGLCSESFTKVSGLKSHIATIHSVEKSRICDECGQVIGKRVSMAQHILEHKTFSSGGGSNKPKDNDIHKCNVCQKVYLRIGNLRNHMKTHRGATNTNQISEPERDISIINKQQNDFPMSDQVFAPDSIDKNKTVTCEAPILTLSENNVSSKSNIIVNSEKTLNNFISEPLNDEFFSSIHTAASEPTDKPVLTVCSQVENNKENNITKHLPTVNGNENSLFPSGVPRTDNDILIEHILQEIAPGGNEIIDLDSILPLSSLGVNIDAQKRLVAEETTVLKSDSMVIDKGELTSEVLDNGFAQDLYNFKSVCGKTSAAVVEPVSGNLARNDFITQSACQEGQAIYNKPAMNWDSDIEEVVVRKAADVDDKVEFQEDSASIKTPTTLSNNMKILESNTASTTGTDIIKQTPNEQFTKKVKENVRRSKRKGKPSTRNSPKLFLLSAAIKKESPPYSHHNNQSTDNDVEPASMQFVLHHCVLCNREFTNDWFGFQTHLKEHVQCCKVSIIKCDVGRI